MFLCYYSTHFSSSRFLLHLHLFPYSVFISFCFFFFWWFKSQILSKVSLLSDLPLVLDLPYSFCLFFLHLKVTTILTTTQSFLIFPFLFIHLFHPFLSKPPSSCTFFSLLAIQYVSSQVYPSSLSSSFSLPHFPFRSFLFTCLLLYELSGLAFLIYLLIKSLFCSLTSVAWIFSYYY